MSSELDLRGLDRVHEPDPAFVEHLRLRLEAAATGATGAAEHHDLVEIPLEPSLRATRSRRRPLLFVAAAAIVLLAVLGSLVWSRLDDSDVTTFAQASQALVGTWVSTDSDLSSQTMEIVSSTGTGFEIELHDDAATGACSGVAATVSGAGALDSTGDLVISIAELSCEDGSEPEVPATELGDLVFTYDRESDTLTDNFGVVWRREGANDPSPAAPPTSGTMWPQANLEEVREAQRLADAEDPDYTWQLDPALSTEDPPGSPAEAEIFTRFLQEELGWEAFAELTLDGHASAPGVWEEVTFIRCAPGQTNPLYPDDSEGGGCAPTIDEHRYERVRIDIAQLDRRGPAGIWVVSQWTSVPPFEQVTPPTDAEARVLLEAFLGARVDRVGADQYLRNGVTPLLYATTIGAPYERFEFEPVDDHPEWPFGQLAFKVRLFAEGGATVVEQVVTTTRDGAGRLLLEPSGIEPTTENGEPVGVPYSLFNGEVTFAAPLPWSCCGAFDYDHRPTLSTLYYNSSGQGIAVIADPLPVGSGCETGPAPADAEALALAIGSDPDLDATEPVPVRIAGTDAVQMDLATVPGASDCDNAGPAVMLTEDSTPEQPAGVWGSRVRLYLLDAPGGSARILAIAIWGQGPDPDGFERLVQAAMPIVDSLEFHTR